MSSEEDPRGAHSVIHQPSHVFSEATHTFQLT